MQEFLRALDDDDDVIAESVEISGGDLSLDLRVVDVEGQVRRWRVAVSGAREHRIQLGWCDSIAIRGDHPLLWPCLDQQGSLYFSGAPSDVPQTIGKLWQRHNREMQGWLPLERFLNREVALDTLLARGAGVLAKGPVRLLQAYAHELEAQQVPWSIAGKRPPKYWSPASEAVRTGGSWAVENRPLQVLTFGESYIVAVSFSASAR